MSDYKIRTCLRTEKYVIPIEINIAVGRQTRYKREVSQFKQKTLINFSKLFASKNEKRILPHHDIPTVYLTNYSFLLALEALTHHPSLGIYVGR